MEGQLSDQWAGVRLLGSVYRSRHYHPWIPNRQARQHRIARGNARHRSGRKFQICLASIARKENDAGYLLQAHHCAWSWFTPAGNLISAHEHIEAGLALYDKDAHRDHAVLYGG